eukprot:jgi/Hompol1/3950/HPOL_003410-RA
MASEDIKSGKCIGVYRGHEGTVYSLDVHWKNGIGPTRSTSASKSRKKVEPEDSDSDIAMLVTGKGMHVFKGHKNIVNCIDVIDTDIFSGSWDMTIIQWSRA